MGLGVHRPRHLFRLSLCSLAAIFVGGTWGYMKLAGLNLRDALYQTVITITTVGYNDLVQDPAYRPFTTLLAAIGAANMTILLSLLTVFLVEEQVFSAFGRRKMQKQVDSLKEHVILCGYGNFGRAATVELQAHAVPYVVIESSPEKAEAGRDAGHPILGLDATQEESLVRAGVERAEALLTTLGTDADNVYVTLTAKQRNPKILVIALARDERAESKLRAAGADRVISPYQLGGSRMARIVRHPTVADFLDMATGANPLDFFMEQQEVREGSRLAGHSLRDAPIRGELGITVIAVQRPDGAMLTNPAPDTMLNEGDVLVSLGPREALRKLEEMASS